MIVCSFWKLVQLFNQLRTSPQTGVREKVHICENQRLRLVQFHDNFIEKGWCTKGHIGFVLKGQIHINFDGYIKKYQQGDNL